MLRIIRELLIYSLILLFPAGEPVQQLEAAPGKTGDAAPQAVQAPQDHAAALEEARILEKVERRYEDALEAYAKLFANETALPISEQAGLGIGRCLMKLGRYDEAVRHLDKLLQRSPSAETAKTAEDLLASIRRLARPGRGDDASSVDNMIWQLLDMACGDNDVTYKDDVWAEIRGMGSLAIPVLKEAALDEDYIRSVTAFNILKHIEDPSVMPFIESCATSPNFALRKRCLDAQTTQSKLKMGGRHTFYSPAVVHYLKDDEEVLLRQALSSDLVFDAYLELPEARRDELVQVLKKHCEGGNAEIRSLALGAAESILSYETRKAGDPRTLPVFGEMIGSVFDRVPPSGHEGDVWTERELEHAISMVMGLAEHEGASDLLRKAMRYWRYPSDRIQKLAIEAACRLPPSGPEEVSRELFDSDDVSVLNMFARCCPAEKFRALPAELRHRFLDAWGRNGKGDPPEGFRLSAEWPPDDWAVLLRAVLENQDQRFMIQQLSGLTCPAPNDPACFDALALYVSHGDQRVRDDGLGLIDRIVRNGSLDPGPDGALKLIGLFLEASATNERDHQDTGRGAQFDPASQRAAGVLSACAAAGGAQMVVDWLLRQETPVVLDDLVANSELTAALIKSDPAVVRELWPRVSPPVREDLFAAVYWSFRDLANTSKPEWLINLLADWKLDPSWQRGDLMDLLLVLRSLDSPRLAGLAEEALRFYLDTYNFQNEFDWYIAGDLIVQVLAESESIADLVPLWYHKAPEKNTKSFGQTVAAVLTAALVHPEKVLSWLAADYPPAFKQEVVDALFDVVSKVPGLAVSLDLGRFLAGIWPQLDRETQVCCLVQAASYIEKTWIDMFAAQPGTSATRIPEDPRMFLTGFLVYLLESEVPPVDRHLAYALIMSAGLDGGVDAVITYLEHLEPGAARRPVAAGNPGDEPIVQKTISIIMRNSWPGFPPAIAYLFSPKVEHRLRFAILGMPVYHPHLVEWASDNLTVGSEADLKAVVAAAHKPLTGEKPRLLRDALDFVLRDWRSQVEGLDEAGRKAVPLPEKAVQLLDEALTSDPYNSEGFRNQVEAALVIIAADSIDAMLPRVREIALHDLSADQRREAVECLGSFLQEENVPTLVQCLKDKDGGVRVQADKALQAYKKYKEQIELWQALIGGEEEGRAADPAVALVEQLRSDDAEVRLYAIKALGKLADPNTLPVLVKMMAEGTPEERAAAKAAVDAITEK